MNDETFNGWCVAAVAIRGDDFRLRAFSVGTFHEEDARQYAYDEVARDYPPSEGWEITTATHRLTGVREIAQ